MSDKQRLSAEDVKRLEVMSALRLPMEHMASILGMSQSTLERRLKRNAAAREAVESGRANASNKVRMTLFRSATENISTVEKFTQRVKNTWAPKGSPEYGKMTDVETTKTKISGPSVEAIKFWCETQEGFRRTERLEIARQAALDAEFEGLTDEQIIARLEKMERVNKR